jgi:fructuronate reductase
MSSGSVRQRLSLATSDMLPSSVRPALEPRALSVGIVHLGLGAFHRAHQAAYTEAAMAASGETGWAISGVSQRSRAVLDELKPQDGLYTLVERGPTSGYRVLAPLRELMFALEESANLLARIAATSTRIVSLTVTEKAYRYSAATKRLDIADAEVRADADGRPPVTVVAQLARGLQQRSRGEGAPITVLCCDNLTNNGATVRGLVADFCALLPAREGAALARWIADNVTFPSTVVDRIVPATTSADLADTGSVLGLDDAAAVVTEPFSQWVIEDAFAAGRPAWHDVGVTFTADVAPYESLKLRLLNASHSALAYLGLLAGYECVGDVVPVEGVTAYLHALMTEAAGTIVAPPDVDVEAYATALLNRFANPGLRHRLQQIAMDGSQKVPVRLLATLRDLRAARHPTRCCVLAVAAWLRYLSARHDDAGRSMTVDDPLAARFAAALAGATDSRAIVQRLTAIEVVFGDLADDDELQHDLVASLDQLSRVGALAALREAVRSPT